MKKVFLLAMFFSFTLFTFANDEASTIKVVGVETESKIILKNHAAISIVYADNNDEVVSITCSLFRAWVKRKLNSVSDNKQLINETADAAKELCEMAKDLNLF